MTALSVGLYGHTVGYLAKDERTGVVSFQYHEEFFKAPPFEPSPVTLSVSADIYRFPELRKTSFRGVPGMIADALPDHYGTRVIEKYFIEQGRNPALIGPLDMLAYIGKRAFGALEFEPAEHTTEQHAPIDIELFNLWEGSRRILRETPEERLPDGLELVYQFGSTAGGARAKAAILFDEENRSFKVHGMAGPLPENHEPWVIKFDGLAANDDDSPKPYERMEYVYNLIASAAGLRVPPVTHVEEASGRFHFMVKRFDRLPPAKKGSGFGKVHMHTISGLLHSDHNEQRVLDYTTVLRYVRALTEDAREVEMAFRYMVFNVMGHNWDDHAKNFALLMDPSGDWRMSPAYDLVYTTDRHPWFSGGHQMTVAGKARGITREDVRQVARSAGIAVGRVDEAIEATAAGFARWEALAEAHGITERWPDYVKAVRRGLDQVALS